MTSDVRLMSDEEVESLISDILDDINLEIEEIEHVAYDYSWAGETRYSYWYYNSKLILELSDFQIVELLFDDNANEVTEKLIDKLKGLIKAEINTKIQNNKNIGLKEFTKEILNCANLSDDEIKELHEKLYLPCAENYLFDDGEISFSTLLEDWEVISRRMS